MKAMIQQYYLQLSMCALQISADNGVFGQTGPKVGSFDAGYGSTQMVRLIGQKKAREMWFLARLYTAQQALEMGLINTVRLLAGCVCCCDCSLFLYLSYTG